MRRLLLLPLLILLAYTACGGGKPTQWFVGSIDEALAEAKTANKDVLLFAWSRG